MYCVLCVVVVVVGVGVGVGVDVCVRVELLFISMRIIVVRQADRRQCSSVQCVSFLIRPIKIVTFPSKNGETPKLVVRFLLKETHF